jgi:carboxypeptidase Taq
MGAFGYFPTYTLGNLVSAQLFRAASKELGDLGPSFARGEFGSLLEWLRSNIHVHGCRYSATELVEMATGRPLSSEDFLDYIRETTAQAYGVTA